MEGVWHGFQRPVQAGPSPVRPRTATGVTVGQEFAAGPRPQQDGLVLDAPKQVMAQGGLLPRSRGALRVRLGIQVRARRRRRHRLMAPGVTLASSIARSSSTTLTSISQT